MTVGQLAISMIACVVLTACGGGGGSGATPASVAAEGQLILIEAGDSQVATGSYSLDTSYTNAAYADKISTGTLESVYPENGAFDTGVSFLQGNTQKYLVGFWSGKTAKGYGCRSNAWTDAELKEVAVVLEDDSIPTAPVCSSTVTINASAHSASYTNLRLPSDSGGSGSILLSANFKWPAPTSPSSGSGSVTSAPISSSNTLASATSTAP
jgi:hypothetical protein